MGNVIIVGSQWGDEGKGKIVDLFSDRFDIVARYQGGHNAGHTVIIGGRKFILKLLPSGILRPGKRVVIGNGVVINPLALANELDELKKAGIEVKNRLAISDRAHIIAPYHPLLEGLSEKHEGKIAIGTTGKGIGPCYEDKIARRGIRMADFLNRGRLRELFKPLWDEKMAMADLFGLKHESFGYIDSLTALEDLAETIRPFVCDTALLLNEAIESGCTVLFEGAQGTMLDIDHGTYPFVTSSNSTAGGACTGTGVPPTKISGIVGASKAYITRVGGGPFPTEISDLDPRGKQIRERGKEYGSVTGRPRRCGWFDAPLLRYTAKINGFDSLVITKLDVLDELDSIPVCVDYEQYLPEGGMFATAEELAQAKPVFKFLPGWRQSTYGITAYADLPKDARGYLENLAYLTECEIGAISTGPERHQTIVMQNSRLAELLGHKAEIVGI